MLLTWIDWDMCHCFQWVSACPILVDACMAAVPRMECKSMGSRSRSLPRNPLRLWTWLHTLFSCIKLQASWCVDLKGSRWHADIGSLLRLFLVFGRFGVGACCRPCQRWGLFCRTWWPGLLISCITSAKRPKTACQQCCHGESDQFYDRMYTFSTCRAENNRIHNTHSYIVFYIYAKKTALLICERCWVPRPPGTSCHRRFHDSKVRSFRGCQFCCAPLG